MTLTPTRARHAFRAMGTDVLVVLDAAASDEATHALHDAERELRVLESCFTRFDPASELRLLERDRARHCSPELVDVIDLALDARRRSRGRFDPTVLPALRAAGYDRTFVDVRDAPRVARRAAPAGGEVRIDHDSGLVVLGDDVALDLGGIAKGWIADRIAERLARIAPALVDAGGDIACTPRADHAPWSIELDECAVRIDIVAGGVATSGTDRRRWIDPASGRTCHHVIDPRTGAPAVTDLVRVTTVAATCAEAEAASTALLVAGSSSLHVVASAFEVAWRAEHHDRTVLETEEFR